MIFKLVGGLKTFKNDHFSLRDIQAILKPQKNTVLTKAQCCYMVTTKEFL